ncbi:MAG: sensor histidine kinase [Desulfobulbaceae bacterium]|nr:sensor histidine kinase [Desulfobulbaceae bacterium]
MTLRNKLIVSFASIFLLVVSLLLLNSSMAREEGRYVQRLLAIHHQYAALLNLKNAVNRQLSEAQDIFIYGKTVDEGNFQETLAQVGEELKRLQTAADLIETLPVASRSDDSGDAKERMVQLQHQYEDLYREVILMLSLFQSGRKAKAQDHFQSEISKRFANFFDQIDAWLVIQKGELVSTEAGFVTINQRHNRTSLLALITILGIVLFFSGVFAYLLGPRLRELLRGTERISRGDFSRPVVAVGNDEFTKLSRAMNQMMADLAASRKKLLEQSYYSGMADMVSGTLHNLCNALSPVVIELETQKQVLEALNVERMMAVCTELTSDSLEAGRRADLVEFLALSCERLRGRLSVISEGMALTRNKVEVVEKVLNQHSHLARMERPMEPIVLAEVVQDCLGLVRQESLEKIPVLVDTSVAAIGPIVSQRIVLVQVLSNLVNNGLESICRAGSADGRIVIAAEELGGSDGRQVHLTVSDTGEGIAAEMLERIFERGISAKEGGEGLGLHWCANATASLSGRLYAESLGAGQGATMHLILKAG